MIFFQKLSENLCLKSKPIGPLMRAISSPTNIVSVLVTDLKQLSDSTTSLTTKRLKFDRKQFQNKIFHLPDLEFPVINGLATRFIAYSKQLCSPL